MASTPVLANRSSFKLDLICQKLQQQDSVSTSSTSSSFASSSSSSSAASLVSSGISSDLRRGISGQCVAAMEQPSSPSDCSINGMTKTDLLEPDSLSNEEDNSEFAENRVNLENSQADKSPSPFDTIAARNDIDEEEEEELQRVVDDEISRDSMTNMEETSHESGENLLGRIDGWRQHIFPNIWRSSSVLSASHKPDDTGDTHCQTISESAVNSTKPNKRKNFKPRPVLHQSEQPAVGEEVPDTVDHEDQNSTCSYDDTEELPLDLTDQGVASSNLCDSNESDAIDLTVKTPLHINRSLLDRSAESAGLSQAIAASKEPSSPTASQYLAQNAMKELLLMYGYSHLSSIGKNPHITGVSETDQKSFGIPPAVGTVPPGDGRLTPPLQQPPTPPQTPCTPTSPAPLNPYVHPLHTAPAHPDLESDRSKLLSHLTNSSNGFLLPPNMASILFAATNGSHRPFLDQVAGSVSPSSFPALASGHSLLPHVRQSPVPAPVSAGSASADKKSSSVDYGKYVKRFASHQECGVAFCSELGYREHFHCVECHSRVFVKKEEMIRHFKWHKKRDDSLQHGFMRYSPNDDCSGRFSDCNHNGKQTHYHCLKEGCNKVYISTSDVQMHANFHRKDSAIQQEGFQRFRASEDCCCDFCPFQGQHTTHFHCKRSGCSYTFKNKADMEKHKSYHIKDEQLNRDGFKKYIKHESCPFDNCRFSKVCNHIHCIRPGCNYVLHSSGQLYSHKRKHERQDSEVAYKNYRLNPNYWSRDPVSMEQIPGSSPLSAAALFSHATPSISSPLFGSHSSAGTVETKSELNISAGGGCGEESPEPTTPTSSGAASASQTDLPLSFSLATPERPSQTGGQLSSWSDRQLLTSYTVPATSDSCSNRECQQLVTTAPGVHFHCRLSECRAVFANCDMALRHAKQHHLQFGLASAVGFEESTATSLCSHDQGRCVYSGRVHHYHCTWSGCHTVMLDSEPPLRRLQHLHVHQRLRAAALDQLTLDRSQQASSAVIAARASASEAPPTSVLSDTTAVVKSECGAVNKNSMPHLKTIWSPAASVKHAAISPTLEVRRALRTDPVVETGAGFVEYTDDNRCPDLDCVYGHLRHGHCQHPRCHFVADNHADLHSHTVDFHQNVDIAEGFAFFSRDVNCGNEKCASNRNSRHFHCTRPDCGFSFVRYTSMSEHAASHSENTQASTSASPSPTSSATMAASAPSLSAAASTGREQSPGVTPVVKAAGTYYPLSAFATPDMPQGLVINSRLSQKDRETGDMYSERRSSSPELPEQRAASTSPDATTTSLVSRLLAPTASTYPSSLATSFTFHAANSTCDKPLCRHSSLQHFHCRLCGAGFDQLAPLRIHLQNHADTLAEQETPVSPTEEARCHKTVEEDVQPLNLDKSQDIRLKIKKEREGFSKVADLLKSPPVFNPFNHAVCYNTENLATSRYQLHSGAFPLMGQQNPASLPVSLQQTIFDHSLLSGKRPASAESPGHDIKKSRSNRFIKDEPVPDGYIRFRFNEDCKYPHCGYREHQTHFHCTRGDCGYSFCDKTRFVQHTARHERLDTLMGGDFVQYRANIMCGRDGCFYANNIDQRQNKASHFHCLKCDFVCTDTNKVVAHRRQHSKLDSIAQAGFEKFTAASGSCHVTSCQHSGRQTHYHCVRCQYAVLGLSQMAAHKLRHMQ